MALSGRMLNGKHTSMAVGASLIILNETGKSGMLRIIGLNPSSANQAQMKIKIEVDGVTIYDKDAYFLFTAGSSYPANGMPINAHSGSSMQLDYFRKLLNIPFVSSLKVTITNTHTVTHDSVWYSADYVLDI